MSRYRFDKPKKLKAALEDFLKGMPEKGKLRKGMVLSVFEDVVGERIAGQCKDVHFEQNKLVIRVSHPTWRNEIHANRFSIMKRLNERAKGKVVEDIIVRT
jgi:hypothetical protein